MLTKLKNNLFYFTIEEFCEFDNNKIYHIRNNISFWNKWLGKDTFDLDFLKETSTDDDNKILLCVNNDEHIEGIAVYNRDQDSFYNLILLAKKNKSKHKGLGKHILRELNSILLDNNDNIHFIVLTDVSDIPNYYTKLGFILTDNKYLKEYIDNFEDDLYFIELNEDNFT